MNSKTERAVGTREMKIDSAWEVYDKAVAPYEKVCDKAIALADEVYEKATTPAREARDKAITLAQKTFDEMTDPAVKAREKATDLAIAECEKELKHGS